jgi:arabinose-5-phosphate isomerase
MRNQYIQSAMQTFEQEINALKRLAHSLENEQQHAFLSTVKKMHACRGKIIVMGMGKSGHIGRKIAATLASTGSPAFFIHPAEASHGDLGMIESQDLLICISNSGETAELLNLINAIKRKNVEMIAITNQPDSSLAKAAQLHLSIRVEKEACPHNLAPTTSTTATLVLGDALAISLLAMHGFTPNDFALSHPGGSLGRRLLTTVADVMRSGEDLPFVMDSATLNQAIVEITRKKIGMTAIIDEKIYQHQQQKKIIGIFTDGDLRRLLEKNIDIRHIYIKDVMHATPKIILQDMMAIQAVEVMQKSKINQLLVIDSNQELIGAVHLHDMLGAHII